MKLNPLRPAVAAALALAGLAAVPSAIAPASAQDVSVKTVSDRMGAPAVEGRWRGGWTDASYSYDADVMLDVGRDGHVEGQVAWTLRASPRAEEQTKIGASAIEYVRGAYVAETGSLMLEGYDREDPEEIIGYDTYRLVVGENGALIAGLTANNGTWDGLMTLRR